MPELPDVEGFRTYIESTSLHQTIEEVDVRSPEILEGISAPGLIRTLEGRRFESTRRHGKHLFIRLDAGGWLFYHFGMTGQPRHFKDMGEDPRYDRMLISFTNGFHLAYDCQRKLGSVGVTGSVDDFLREKKRGPDALGTDFPTFRESLQGRRGAIKSALMNQRILAGIGNVYSDEILFQAQIHPKKPVNSLDGREFSGLFQSMGSVLRAGIDHTVRSRSLPDSFLLTHRGEGEGCPRCGGRVAKLKISGRTAYYCPKCQADG